MVGNRSRKPGRRQRRGFDSFTLRALSGPDEAARRTLQIVIYVHARTERAANQWARGQGYRPRDFRTFGNYSGYSMRGLRYTPGDRVIVIGDVSHSVESFIEVTLRKCPAPAPVPEWYWAPTSSR